MIELPQKVLDKLSNTSDAQEVLKSLKERVKNLEQKRHIKITSSLEGGTSALVALIATTEQQKIIAKIPLRTVDIGAEFANEIKALKFEKGKAYVKLLDFEEELNIAFLEQLGAPLGTLDFSINEQIEIICRTLQTSWLVVDDVTQFSNTLDLVEWFTNYINLTWQDLNQPFSKKILDKVNCFIEERRKAFSIDKLRLVHGDAHNFNILQAEQGNNERFKLIDPDGIVAEPAYDLGVLMREWIDELLIEPQKNLLTRLNLLQRLTGIEKEAIWQWGLIQTLATALVLQQSNQIEEGQKLLKLARFW